MAEITKVNLQQADERCPQCKNGFMRPTGIVEVHEPTQYEHKCNAGCGHAQYYPMRFPYLIGN